MFLNKLKRWRLKRRLEKENLGMITTVPTELFHIIIEQLAQRGWEVSIDYRGINGWDAKGQCKLRKGTSVLEFSWHRETQGNIIGLKRIVSGIATEFGLTLHNQPM